MRCKNWERRKWGLSPSAVGSFFLRFFAESDLGVRRKKVGKLDTGPPAMDPDGTVNFVTKQHNNE